VEDSKQAFAHALEHCVGILHSTSIKNKDLKIDNDAGKNARGPRFDIELYAIQGDVLYRVDGTTGDYYPLAKGWAETEVMGQINGTLYMVQFGTLYAVNPATGKYTPLTNGWEGSQYITDIPGGRLYIMQDSWIWPVDPDTGLWDGDKGSYTLARGLTSFLDQKDNKYKLAVLRRKPGSHTVSLLYIIKPSNGHLYSQTTIPASGMDDWNGGFFLASTWRLNIFNGTANWVDDDGQYTGASHGDRPHMELVAPYHPAYVYFISDGTLYRIVQKGGYWVERLGEESAWVDTSCLVYLQ
jgi:hypothetical protein